MESPRTQASAKGTIWNAVMKTVPTTPRSPLGQRIIASGAAHRPPISANREAHFAPSVAAV